jgi:peptidoglycan/xylan/chitin deacetylase (PgdA/CDA1 family)
MIPAMTAAARPLDGLVTIMWHYVRDPGEQPGVGASAVDPGTFEAQLDAVARHRVVVGWPDVATALGGGPPLPPRATLLTFDDGLVDHVRTVAPRLVDRGWPAVFFVMARGPGDRLSVGHSIHVLLAILGAEGLGAAITEQLGPSDAERFRAAQARERAAGVEVIDVLKRPLQRDLADAVGPILSRLVDEHLGSDEAVADALHLGAVDVARLRRDGMTIGGHGRRHLWFDHEPTERVASEVAASAAFLAEEPRPWAFAYPYGASSPAATAALRDHGFGAAFHAAPRRATGRFDLGRIDAEESELAAILAGSGSR